MSSPASTATPTRFTFHACLGEGAFGEVYRATAHGPGGDELVAVKVLHVERQRQRAAVDRLRDEAKMLAVLNHPAILRFNKFTRIDGRLALVTEYIEGVDISAFGDPSSPMPLKAALEVSAQVASALVSALNTPSPETGRPLRLVHRDVKPQNIRISRSGEVKLLDFGIARTTELTRDAQTSLGEVLCTPGYASPELLCGDPSGHASDIYALGVTLFALTATTRFYVDHSIPKQRKLALLRDRYASYLDSRMAVLPELPEDLVDLMRRMLAYDYEQRPDGDEVHWVLSRIAGGLGGPGLAVWSRDLPDQVEQPGELCGRTVEETPISVEATQVPLATRRQLPPTLPSGMQYSSVDPVTDPPPAAPDVAALQPPQPRDLRWTVVALILIGLIGVLLWVEAH